MDVVEAYRAQCMSDVTMIGAFPDRAKANEYCLGIARSNAAHDEKLRNDPISKKAAAQLKADRDARREREQREMAIEAERQRVEAVEEQEHEAAMKDPAFIRRRLSLLLCYAEVSRRHAQERLDDERLGARRGLGVIKKDDVYEYQGELVVMSKLERLVKADLKARRMAPGVCKSAETNTFAECIHVDRMQPTFVDMIAEPNYNEYTASANRIIEFSVDCAPWERKAGPPISSPGHPAAERTF